MNCTLINKRYDTVKCIEGNNSYKANNLFDRVTTHRRIKVNKSYEIFNMYCTEST